MACYLGSREDVGRFERLSPGQFDVIRQVDIPGSPADSSCIDDPESGSPELFLRIGGIENSHALLEEQALLRKKGFVSGKVDDHIVGLDGAEVRVDCCRELEVGRWSPEHIRSSLPLFVIIDVVKGYRGVGENAPLLAGVNLPERQWLKCAYKAWLCFG